MADEDDDGSDLATAAAAKPMHVVWRRAYDERRYLRHATHADLLQRLKDVLLNIVGIGEGGRVGALGGDAKAVEWWRTFTELLEEFQLRFGPYPAGLPEGFLRDAPLPDNRPALTQRAIAAVKRVKVQPGACLFKYGKKEHLRAGLEGGPFRISAASHYNDPSLNHAIGDNELSIETHAPADGFFVTVVKSKNVPAGTRIPMTGNLSVTTTLNTNYYVWCFSRHLYAALFRDAEQRAQGFRLLCHRVGGEQVIAEDALLFAPASRNPPAATEPPSRSTQSLIL